MSAIHIISKKIWEKDTNAAIITELHFQHFGLLCYSITNKL